MSTGTIERRRARRIAALLLLGSHALACHAGDRLDLQGVLDLRLIDSDGSPSFLEGGLGRQRFDADHDGLRLGRAFVDARLRLGDTLTAHVVAGSYGDHDVNAVDLTEAYLDYRPYPEGAWRWRLRGGMFYAPISLENRGPGWTNVYTVSNSAIATWIGEEIRTVGLEAEARWRGQVVGSANDVSLVLGVFGWNDPAGTLVAARGFALHDRQTAAFGHLPYPGSAGSSYEMPPIEMFREIDDRPGYYAGVAWRYRDMLELRAQHYDNRGDPTALDDDTFAWDTHFDVLGLRFEPDEHWTLIAQLLDGVTVVGGPGAVIPTNDWDLKAAFLLTSYAWGPNRLSARYDWFETRQQHGFGIGEYDDDGDAGTIAYLRDFGEHWQLGAEWLRIHSTFDAREDHDVPATLGETQVQMVVRYKLRVRR
jgi:hypothetical protein